MKINLNEIPAEGKSWILNRHTSELNSSLSDLIVNEPYDIQFNIHPLSSGNYTLSGQVKTKAPEECSRCGIDFKLSILKTFKTILMPEQEENRTDQYSKSNHISDTPEIELDVYEYSGNSFNAGEFFHELIGLEIPFVPVPETGKDGNCLECKKPVSSKPFSYEEAMPQPESPFTQLKDLKIKKSDH